MRLATYACDIITLKEGYVPYSGFFNLLIPNYITYNRVAETKWYSQFQPHETKEIIDYISKRVYVLSAFEKSLNLFILSTGFRCFTVLCSSLKLAVDKSSFRPFVKNSLSIAISVLPGLVLYYFMDYSVRDYIIGEVIMQSISAASSAFSHKWGNYFRRLDLISDDKNFGLINYLSKSAFGITSNILITLVVYGVKSLAYPYNEMVSENVIRYCVEMDKSNLSSVANNIAIWAHKSRTMISVREKTIFFAGKILVDSLFVVANFFGKQEDLRSPFINVFKKSPAEIKRDALVKLQKEKEELRLQKRLKKQENKKKGNIDAFEVAEVKPFSSKIELAVIRENDPQVLTQRKLKEKQKANPKEQPKSEVIASSSESLTREVEIGDKTFYPIHSDKLPENTWAVVNLKKAFLDVSQFESCLKRNAMESSSSRVVYDKVKKMFKIKPATVGERVLGCIHHGSSGFDRLLDLANSITAQERLRAEGNGVEPNLIIFDQLRKHDDVYKR